MEVKGLSSSFNLYSNWQNQEKVESQKDIYDLDLDVNENKINDKNQRIGEYHTEYGCSWGASCGGSCETEQCE